MKYQEAINIIKNGSPKGYMIDFEHREDGILISDHFPDKFSGEKLIPTEEEAWELASQFAISTDDTYVNIYVVDNDFNPVANYDKLMYKKY